MLQLVLMIVPEHVIDVPVILLEVDREKKMYLRLIEEVFTVSVSFSEINRRMLRRRIPSKKYHPYNDPHMISLLSWEFFDLGGKGGDGEGRRGFVAGGYFDGL